MMSTDPAISAWYFTPGDSAFTLPGFMSYVSSRPGSPSGRPMKSACKSQVGSQLIDAIKFGTGELS